ncbi:MAG: winged helix-turn-helix domain-containing protein [Acidobacteriota bacterium]
MGKTETPFVFDGWNVYPDRNRLRAPSGDAVDLPPKVMELLLELVHGGGRVLTRRELLDRVWEGRAVGDEVLTVAVHHLRKTLGDRAESARYVETIKGRGYRWCTGVDPLPMEGHAPGVVEGASRPPSSVAVRPPRPSPRSVGLGALAAFLGLALWALWPLPRPSAPRVSDLRPTVALRPIVPASPSRDDGALAEVLAAGLVQALTVRDELGVIRSRKGDGDPPEISALLDVTILRRLDILQASVSLLDPGTGRSLWGERFTGPISDLPALEAAIAAAVAAQLRVGGTTGEVDAAPSTDAWVPKAAKMAWVDAELSIKEGTPEGYAAAEADLARAVSLAPGFAPVRVSRANLRLRQRGSSPPAEAAALLEAARRDVEDALALDPGFGPAWTLSALLYLYFDWDLDSAEVDFRRAFQHSSAAAAPHAHYLQLLCAQGRHRAAEAQARKAVRLDPWNPDHLLNLASVLLQDDRLEEALGIVESMGEPRPRVVERLRAGLLDLLGRDAEALEVYLPLIVDGASEVGTAEVETSLRAAFAAGGLPAFYSRWLEVDRGALEGLLRAAVEARAGETEASLATLGQLLEHRDPSLLTLAKEPAFGGLRDDPRFLAILDSVRALATNRFDVDSRSPRRRG